VLGKRSGSLLKLAEFMLDTTQMDTGPSDNEVARLLRNSRASTGRWLAGVGLSGSVLSCSFGAEAITISIGDWPLK
jgi:hypothetical protein